MKLVIDPEWSSAPFELQLLEAGGALKPLTDPVRFREQDKEAAIQAMKEHDNETLNRLAVRRYMSVP